MMPSRTPLNPLNHSLVLSPYRALATSPSTTATTVSDTTASLFKSDLIENRTSEAMRQLFCGGVAGSVAKTVTAPLSRLTILFQVHSLVTTKGHRPKFAMSLRQGLKKIVERGGILALWRGNGTSVLHRFPYSAINFFVYERTLDALSAGYFSSAKSPPATSGDELEHGTTHRPPERNETQRQLVRRVSLLVSSTDHGDEGTNDDFALSKKATQPVRHNSKGQRRDKTEDTPAVHKFIAGATAGSLACLACYPLDLVRTRLTTELEGQENYKGIVDAFRKIARSEGFFGFYAGVTPTLLVAVPNFAISYTVYGTLKEHALDDELFYNLRRIDADSGEPKLGFGLTVACGAASGILATLITFPMDTIRRRMQIQALHFAPADRLSSRQQFLRLVRKEGLGSLYRGLTPELLKVVPMVGTMFVVYEFTKEALNVKHNRG
jgi:Mitochondrial carrier protein